jgi:hypothetical protein
LAQVSIEEYEREHWLNGALPESSAHLSFEQFIAKRQEERFVRAVEADEQGRYCVVCGGPVFVGSSLGPPITFYVPSPDPALAHISVNSRPTIPDCHFHRDCFRETQYLRFCQQLEAKRLREGRME